MHHFLWVTPLHQEGPQLKNLLIWVVFIQWNIYYNFPKFARKQFYHLNCHIKLPQRKFCTVNQFLCWTNFLESLHPTHPLKIHRPLGSTCSSGVPKFVSPACRKYKVMKNRVARFHKNWFLETKLQLLVHGRFWTAHGFEFLPFMNIL